MIIILRVIIRIELMSLTEVEINLRVLDIKI
jgi:hypothetical protein